MKVQSDQYHHEHLCAPAPERRRGGGGSSRPCVEWGRGEQEASVILVFIWCLSSRMAEAHGGASGRMVSGRTLEKSRFFQPWRGLACVRAMFESCHSDHQKPPGSGLNAHFRGVRFFFFYRLVFIWCLFKT